MKKAFANMWWNSPDSYPPSVCGKHMRQLSSTFSVVRLPRLPIVSGRLWIWLVVRWRSANETQPSISLGREVRQFLQPSKNINCFRLPIVCGKNNILLQFITWVLNYRGQIHHSSFSSPRFSACVGFSFCKRYM